MTDMIGRCPVIVPVGDFCGRSLAVHWMKWLESIPRVKWTPRHVLPLSSGTNLICWQQAGAKRIGPSVSYTSASIVGRGTMIDAIMQFAFGALGGLLVALVIGVVLITMRAWK
jgi:hypothetical protein